MTRTAKIMVIMLFCLTGLLTVEQKAASAQSTLEKNVIYGQDKIGTYQNELEQSADPSVSVVGVKVRLKQSLGYDVITYAADTWNKTADGTWKYIGTEVDGEQGQFGSMMQSYSSINIWGYTSPRFGIITGMMRNYMSKKLPEEYSVVTRKIVRGTETSRTTQYSFQTQEQLAKQKDSLLHALRGNGEVISVCEHVATGTSYEYTIYPAQTIDVSQKKIAINTGSCAVEQVGTAFFDGSHYYLYKLPKLCAPTGYTMDLEGWYDQKQGGTKYEEGSLLPMNKTLYARYTLTKNKYSVICIDKIRDSKGIELGRTEWMQEYATTADGASRGSVPLPDTYYEGVRYIGATRQSVGTAQTIVYRFFDYADYAVTVVDVVKSTAAKDVVLGSHQIQCPYQKFISGGELVGDNTEEGAYYLGYVYRSDTSDRVLTKGTTVYRYFNPITYDVLFDGNGATEGEMEPMQGCRYGLTYTLPLNSFKRNIKVRFDLQAEDAVFGDVEISIACPFEGWSDKEDGSVLFQNGASFLNLLDCSGTKQWYAHWGEAAYTVQKMPNRMGYQFAGWSTDPNAVQGQSAFSFSEDTTLYAIWKADVVEYHVEYYKEKLDGLFEKAASYAFHGYTGKEISVENVEQLYPGYYIDATSSTLSGRIKGDGSLVLSVYYRRNSYSLQFHLEGGSLPAEYRELKGKYEETITIPKETPKKERCEFLGWTADRGSTQIYIKAGETYHIPNHDQILYAVWKPDSYKVKYMLDDHSNEVVIEKEYAYDEELDMPECTSDKKGYQFVGWKFMDREDAGCYQAGDRLESLYRVKDEVIRMYAVWRPVQGNIIFDANFEEEEDAVSGTMNPIFYQYESECLIPDNKYKVAGYTFAGWSMKRDGSGKRYHTGDDLKNVFDTEGDHTLYGVWKTATDTPFRIRVCKTNVAGDKEIEEVLHLQGETNCSVRQALFDFYEMDSLEKVFHGFKVVDSNALNTTIRRDGSTEVTIHLQRKTYRVIVMSETEKPYYEKECIYEEEITLPTELEGVGNVARYSSENGMNYSGDLPFSVMDDMTLVPQHSVCYWLDGQIEEQFVTHGKETEAFTPEEKGYCFDGWYTSKELDARFCDAGERISVSENMTLYGKWTTNKKSYTITYDFGDYDDVIALEELTPCYTYGGTVLLPTAVQLDIPDRYEFVGWYEKGDETHKIIRRIIGSMYGDKTFCLYLRERTVLPTPTLPSASEIPSPSVEPMDPSTTDDPSSSDTPLDPSVSAAPMPSNVPNNSASNLPQTPNKTIIQNPLQGSDKKLGKAQNDTFTVRKITYRVLSVKKKTVTVTGADKSISVLRIPASVTKNRVKYRVVKVSSKAFYKHNNLRKVIIGKHVTAIGNKAFAYNRKLKFASLGRSVTKIGTKSFYGNKKLKKLVISGKKLRTVGTKAFSSGQSGKIIVKAVKGKQKKYCRLLRKAGMKSKIRVS